VEMISQTNIPNGVIIPISRLFISMYRILILSRERYVQLSQYLHYGANEDQ